MHLVDTLLTKEPKGLSQKTIEKHGLTKEEIVYGQKQLTPSGRLRSVIETANKEKGAELTNYGVKNIPQDIQRILVKDFVDRTLGENAKVQEFIKKNPIKYVEPAHPSTPTTNVIIGTGRNIPIGTSDIPIIKGKGKLGEKTQFNRSVIKHASSVIESSNMTDKEITRLTQNIAHGIDNPNKIQYRLSDVMDNQALFERFPQLANTPIFFVKKIVPRDPNLVGLHSSFPRGNVVLNKFRKVYPAGYIQIKTHGLHLPKGVTRIQKMIGTIAHETQHAIDFLTQKRMGERKTLERQMKTLKDLGVKTEDVLAAVTPGSQFQKLPSKLKKNIIKKIKTREITDEAVAKAVANIAEKTKGTRLSMNIDPTLLKDYAVVGARLLEDGFIKIKDWKEKMGIRFGPKVKPHLKRIYNQALRERESARAAAAPVKEIAKEADDFAQAETIPDPKTPKKKKPRDRTKAVTTQDIMDIAEEFGAIPTEASKELAKKMYDKEIGRPAKAALDDAKKPILPISKEQAAVAHDLVLNGVEMTMVTKAVDTMDAYAQNMAARAFNTYGWALPASEVMRHPILRRAYEAAWDYTTSTEKFMAQVMNKRVMPALNSIPKNLKQEVWEGLQKDIKHASESARPYIENMRNVLNELRQFGIDNGLSIHKIENYVPHIFEGNWRVWINGQLHTKFFKNHIDAVNKAIEVIKAGGEADVGPVMPKDAYDIYLREARMGRLIGKLHRSSKIPSAEIREYLRKANVKQVPKERFFGNMLQRKTNNPDFIKDLDVVIRMYAYGISRKVYQDKFKKEITALREEAVPKLGEVLEKYEGRVAGVPQALEEWIASVTASAAEAIGLGARDANVSGLKRIIWMMSAAQYVYDLGLMTSSAAVNLTQLFINTIPLTRSPAATAKGIKAAVNALRDPKSKERLELQEMGITAEISSALEGQDTQLLQNKLAKWALDFPLFMFKGVEISNRANTYFIGKNLALSNPKKVMKILDTLQIPESARIRRMKGEEFAREFGAELVNNTQFRIEKFNAPGLLTSPTFKLLAPYKGFLINQHVLMFKLLKAGLRDPLKLKSTDGMQALAAFMAASFAIGGKETNPLTSTTYAIMEEAYERVYHQKLGELKVGDFKLGEIMEFGFPAQFDYDFTSALLLQNPTEYLTDPLQATGRYADLGIGLAKGTTGLTQELWATVTGEGLGFTKSIEAGKEVFDAAIPRFGHKAIDVLFTDAVSEGVKRTKKGLKLIETPKGKTFRTLSGLPMKEVLNAYRTESKAREITDWYASNVASNIRVAADKALKGDIAGTKKIFHNLNLLNEHFSKRRRKATGQLQLELSVKQAMLIRAVNRERIFIEAIKGKNWNFIRREKDKVLRTYKALFFGLLQKKGGGR